MTPLPITEDYYKILEVEQTASPELIVSSYRRLARQLHPDRNAKEDATEAFQQARRAYETLKDETKRRDYDLIYPSITKTCLSSVDAAQSELVSDGRQLAAFLKVKEEHSAKWQAKKDTFELSLSELQRRIQQLELEIRTLDTVFAAEAAEEAWKSSWGAWLLSTLYKKSEENEEEKAGKDRARQERRIEKDMKERRLGLIEADFLAQNTLLQKAKAQVDYEDLVQDRIIQATRSRIKAREDRKKKRKEKAEKERMAEIWRQQREQREKLKREAAEAWEKEQAEWRAAEQRRQEEDARKWQKMVDETNRRCAHYSRFDFTEGTVSGVCSHDLWWPKVQGRTACPNCSESWTYLLQCPGCDTKACPRCQAAIRPRRRRHAARTDHRTSPRARTPSPKFNYDEHFDYPWD